VGIERFGEEPLNDIWKNFGCKRVNLCGFERHLLGVGQLLQESSDFGCGPASLAGSSDFARGPAPFAGVERLCPWAGTFCRGRATLPVGRHLLQGSSDFARGPAPLAGVHSDSTNDKNSFKFVYSLDISRK
jgi:hypothetical protein